MDGDEILIGFDAREAGDNDPRWDDHERRERYLLRRGVARPLSVDRHVWPTVFDIWFSERNREFRPTWSDEERFVRGFGSIATPDWAVATNAPLWQSLDRMTAYLDEQGADSATTVAVGWLSRSDFREVGKAGPHPVPSEPARPGSGWTRLGYDVADDGRISGLSNCGYTPGEGERLREEWAPRLNARHLFDSASDAYAFVELANERVAEHAPFQVYSLYLTATSTT